MERFRDFSAGVAFLGLVILAGCTSLRAEHDYDPTADFSGYKTFSWIGPRPLLEGGQSPLLEGRLMRITDEALRSKGYHFVPDPEGADFVVAFTVGARDKIKVTSYPSHYRGFNQVGWGGRYYNEVNVQNYTEGTLSIDIFDVSLRNPVWHGWAVKTISSQDRRNPTPVINEIVAAIFADFPTK